MDTKEPTSLAPVRTYIVVHVAGTSYALRSHEVRHIEMVDQVTPVPNRAAFVEGVVFSRGNVLPVINLRVRFGFERTPPDVRSRLVVVEVGGRLVALLVDDAREFITIPDAAVHPPSDAIGGLSGDYLEGVATMGDRIVLV